MKQAAASWSKGRTHRVRSHAATKVRSVVHTARRRYSRRRHRSSGGFSQQKMFKLLRFGALVAPAAFRALGTGSAQDKVQMGMRDYFGWNSYTGQMEWSALLNGWGPFIAASVATYGIPKLTKILRGI